MNDEVRQCAAVMLAYADGKTIQYRKRYGPPGNTPECDWSDHQSPQWNWTDFEYRVKPEPMEIEVWVSPHGELSLYKPHSLGNLEWTPRKFREVT